MRICKIELFWFIQTDGFQFFEIDEIQEEFRYLKIMINQTFGGLKTYLNQICLLERNPNSQEEILLSELSFEAPQPELRIKVDSDFERQEINN